LLYVRDDQINMILPGDAYIAPLYNRAINVSSINGLSASFRTFFLVAAPGIYTLDASGYGQGAIVNEDGTINSPANPAARGSIISVYGTGGGVTTPTFPDGSIVPKAANLVNGGYLTVGLRIGQMLYQGAAPTLLNGATVTIVRIPPDVTPGPAVAVRKGVFYGGGTIFSQPGVTVSVK